MRKEIEKAARAHDLKSVTVTVHMDHAEPVTVFAHGKDGSCGMGHGGSFKVAFAVAREDQVKRPS